jgi:F-type H+-transporting ATPase subunit delta
MSLDSLRVKLKSEGSKLKAETMSNPRLAYRYAKSIIDLSQERGQLEDVFNDMLFLQKIIKDNRDLLVLLRSPVITADKKINVVEAVTAGRVTEITALFNKLLINKGRESALPEVITSFIQQYKELKQIHTVKLTTATPISQNLMDAFIEQIKRTTAIQNIELEAKVDEKIIGGFVLQTGDQLIDASVSYDLREVAKQFQNNDFIYNIR